MQATSDWVSAIRKSDENAFEQVFRTYFQALCNYANSLLKDMDEAEETVQSVFHIFWEKRETIEISGSLKSYLYKSVHNRSLNRLKHDKIKNAYKDYNAEQIKQNPVFASDMVIENELNDKIINAIESLPDKCKTIFKLSRFEELKYAEIAKQLGISVKTVENQMGKALKILRGKLADYLVLWLLVYLTIL